MTTPATPDPTPAPTPQPATTKDAPKVETTEGETVDDRETTSEDYASTMETNEEMGSTST